MVHRSFSIGTTKQERRGAGNSSGQTVARGNWGNLFTALGHDDGQNRYAAAHEIVANTGMNRVLSNMLRGILIFAL